MAGGRRSVCIIALVAAYLAGCGPKKEVRLYDGPPLAPGDEVQLRSGGISYIAEVDAKAADALMVRLKPGMHAVKVKCDFKAFGGHYTSEPPPVSFYAKPGEHYYVQGLAVDMKFYTAITPGESELPVLSLPGIADGTKPIQCQVLERDTKKWNGTGTIFGTIYVEENRYFFKSINEQRVQLLPKNEESKVWAERQMSSLLPGPLQVVSWVGDASYKAVPQSMTDHVYTVVASSGQGFAFHNVPPGTYYVAARHPLIGGGMQEVVVGPGQTVSGVRLVMRR